MIRSKDERVGDGDGNLNRVRLRCPTIFVRKLFLSVTSDTTGFVTFKCWVSDLYLGFATPRSQMLSNNGDACIW